MIWINQNDSFLSIEINHILCFLFLQQLISGHFDTTTGPKQESSSYTKIANVINRQPEDFLFLTDVPKEAVAAQAAGFTSIIVYRPGNVEVDSDTTLRFPSIESFDEIKFV